MRETWRQFHAADGVQTTMEEPSRYDAHLPLQTSFQSAGGFGAEDHGPWQTYNVLHDSR